VPLVSRKWHVLYKSHIHRAISGELHEIADFILVEVPHEDTVHLGTVAQLNGKIDASYHSLPTLSPGDLLKAIPFQRVQTDVEGIQPCPLQWQKQADQHEAIGGYAYLFQFR